MSFTEITGSLLSVLSVGQNQLLHQKELELAKKLHEKELETARKQHMQNMRVTRQTYLLQILKGMEQHFQQLNADLIASSRESERDMFDQRNHSFQTVILASSVMFSALSSVIVEGKLPPSTTDVVLVAYALTSALSFAFLFLCILFSMELVVRTSLFMYRRAYKHTRTLEDAISKTRKMMEQIRGGGEDILSHSTRTGKSRLPDTTNNEGIDQSHDISRPGLAERGTTCGSTMSQRSVKVRSVIAEMSPEQVEQRYRTHEKEIDDYMKEREIINRRTAIDLALNEPTFHPQLKAPQHPNTKIYNRIKGSCCCCWNALHQLFRLFCGKSPNTPEDEVKIQMRRQRLFKLSFQAFWKESCSFWWSLSILFFYVGSLNLLLAILIFLGAQFLIVYDSIAGAIVAVSLISLVLMIGIASVIVLRYIDEVHNYQEKYEQYQRRMRRKHHQPQGLYGNSSVSGTLDSRTRQAHENMLLNTRRYHENDLELQFESSPSANMYSDGEEYKQSTDDFSQSRYQYDCGGQSRIGQDSGGVTTAWTNTVRLTAESLASHTPNRYRISPSTELHHSCGSRHHNDNGFRNSEGSVQQSQLGLPIDDLI